MPGGDGPEGRRRRRSRPRSRSSRPRRAPSGGAPDPPRSSRRASFDRRLSGLSLQQSITSARGAVASLSAIVGATGSLGDGVDADPLVVQANGVLDAAQRCHEVDSQARGQQHYDSGGFACHLEQYLDNVKEIVAFSVDLVAARADFLAFTGWRAREAQANLQEMRRYVPGYQGEGEISSSSIERYQSEQVIRCGAMLRSLLDTLGIPQPSVGEDLQPPVDTGLGAPAVPAVHRRVRDLQ